uniref:Ubiquinol oxidase n=1 Tax=Cucumis melo TaxID=3656 RepID=A0A9I9DNW7_CUCME
MTSSTAASPVFALSSFQLKPVSNTKNYLPSSFSIPTTFFPLSPLISRKSSFRAMATVVKENEEKVVVEESFPPKASPAQDGEGDNNQGPQSLSSTHGFDNWIITFEQSINVFLTDSVIRILDAFYHDRYYARFFVLETIARVPYFGEFQLMLTQFDLDLIWRFYVIGRISFGWWRRADYLKVHFAESWNEMHHLLIMEFVGYCGRYCLRQLPAKGTRVSKLFSSGDNMKSLDTNSLELGGNDWWFDRFLAQHIAVAYYFMTVFMYMISPRMAYHLSECVESHAFSTYDKFLKAQGDELKKLPAPEVAVKYYTEGDLYLFDEFQTSRPPKSRRPKIESLYDVFVNIRDDEGEHCKTMKACQSHGNLRSPHSYSDSFREDNESLCDPNEVDCEGIVDSMKKSSSLVGIEFSCGLSGFEFGLSMSLILEPS